MPNGLVIGFAGLLVCGGAMGVCIRGAIVNRNDNQAFLSAFAAGLNLGCVIYDALYLSTKL